MVIVVDFAVRQCRFGRPECQNVAKKGEKSFGTSIVRIPCGKS